jgi:ribokinase
VTTGPLTTGPVPAGPVPAGPVPAGPVPAGPVPAGPGRVVCVGDVMVDVLAKLPGPLAVGSDCPAPVELRPGGSAANTAAWLAVLGAPVVFAGRVGDDAFGREAVQSLRLAGVQCHVAVDRRAATGVCLVLIDPSGERTMVPSAGANAELAAGQLVGLLAPGDHLHVSGYSLLSATARAAALAIMAEAQRLGAGVSVDANSAAPIRSVGAAQLLRWLPAGCLLIANADELAALTDDRPDALRWLAAQGLRVVVKDGAAGARVAEHGALHTVPTTPVPVLDSTGAGDAFAAGLLDALRRGGDLVTATAAANRAGARALGVLGGRPAPADFAAGR